MGIKPENIEAYEYELYKNSVLIMTVTENKLNYNKVGSRLVVSQNEITWVFKILNIFCTASPFSRGQINTDVPLSFAKHIKYFKNLLSDCVKPLSDALLCYLKMFHLVPLSSSLLNYVIIGILGCLKFLRNYQEFVKCNQVSS